jgi:8-oxo-dGTP pyrophosphatase MutT (NUDIX family)
MDWKIDVTVAALIEQDRRFLCVEERVGDRLVFNQPAGHLEAGESLLEAVVREVAEETGFTFAPEGIVGVYLWPCDAAERSYLRVCFAHALSTDVPALFANGIRRDRELGLSPPRERAVACCAC